MTNPYQNPTVALSDKPIKNATGGKVQLSLGLSCSLLVALLVTFIVPSFVSVYKSFGADLPLLTYLVINFYLAIWFLPLFVLFAFYRWPTPSRRPLLALLIGIIGSLVIVPLIVFALYSPIIDLANSA